MKKLHFIFFLLLIFGVSNAQEKLSKEEQARREKNIQAGNPFAQFGYKAKVATLSKGKYLEFHDLDSIVTIGTMRWHVDREQIIAQICARHSKSRRTTNRRPSRSMDVTRPTE
jgi:hypothetical protein